MPFLKYDEAATKQVFIGETEFVNPEDEKDLVQLYIYLASPKFA